MKKLLLILLCLPMIGFGQVYIPDTNFKAYLVGNSFINTNGDSEIQLSEANSFGGTITCPNMNITDLTGIEAFTNLTELWCQFNQLTSLDVSNNTALTWLSCQSNQLTTLDVSNNTALGGLWCKSNQLSSLDVNGAIALISLSCSFNLITSLDVSANTALDTLLCQSNQLTSLDVRNGNNTNMSNSSFNATDNPHLGCISVDNWQWSYNNWLNVNGQEYFSDNCPPSAIQEKTTKKELLKVTDFLGRETKQTNQLLLYIYNDGTVEKRIVIE